MKAYLVDVGVLLSENDDEFESYAIVYDKKYGYYDENQFYLPTEEEAIDFAKVYVKDGVDNTYGVISLTELDDDFDFTDCVFGPEHYLLNDVVYSVAKINGKIVENFIEV